MGEKGRSVGVPGGVDVCGWLCGFVLEYLAGLSNRAKTKLGLRAEERRKQSVSVCVYDRNRASLCKCDQLRLSS